jgi:hypothetical protein
MARNRLSTLEDISDEALDDAVSRTPADQYVIWNGCACPIQPGSLRSLAFALIEAAWAPAPLRILVRRAARLSGRAGFEPHKVRSAVFAHQTAGSASYFLVRRTLAGDYVAVTSVPYPSSGAAALRAGDLVLGRSGERFDVPMSPSRGLQRA